MTSPPRPELASPPEVPADHGLKFYWNGIKHNGGPLARCHYSGAQLLNHPEGTITIYGRDYNRLPKAVARCFHVENDSDMQTDYFENDRIRVGPNHPLYALVRAALQAQEAHQERRLAKRGL